MSTLHVLSRSTLPGALRRCLGAGDHLLLRGDGVYVALTAGALPVECAALECDVRARGLLAQWPDSVALVDHGGYVDLCVHHDKSLEWS